MEYKSVNDQKVANHFDELARFHGDVTAVLDASVSRTNEIARKNIYRDYILKYSLKKYCSFRADDNILDFGCGVGRLSGWLSQYVKLVEGCDISGEMINVAERINSAPNIRYTRLTEGLPYSNGWFSKIISCWVMQHISDEALHNLLLDMKRTLKPGGRMYVLEQINMKTLTRTDTYIQRSIEQYKQIFIKTGWQTVDVRPTFRSPSYALSLWSHHQWIPKGGLPLLSYLEHKTVTRKPEHIEYLTCFMEVKIAD